MESKITSSDFAIGAYLKLCARLRFFDVTGQEDVTPMLDFMIARIPILKGILNGKFFGELVSQVQQEKAGRKAERDRELTMKLTGPFSQTFRPMVAAVFSAEKAAATEAEDIEMDKISMY